MVIRGKSMVVRGKSTVIRGKSMLACCAPDACEGRSETQTCEAAIVGHPLVDHPRVGHSRKRVGYLQMITDES